MSTNKLLIAGLLGSVTAFILGWLFYGTLLMGFFEKNAGSATGVNRPMEEMVWWAMILGHLAFGYLFALIFGRWASISTFVTGAKAGAVIGGLMALMFDMIMYGSTNISNLTAALVDVVVMVVTGAIVGGVVGWWLGRK
jgi:hypothetical protein